MHLSFHTLRTSLRHMHDLYRTIPSMGSSNRSGIRSKTNQRHILIAEFLTCQSSQIHFSTQGHVGGTVVTNMSVMGPYNGLRLGSMALKQALKRLHHICL